MVFNEWLHGMDYGHHERGMFRPPLSKGHDRVLSDRRFILPLDSGTCVSGKIPLAAKSSFPSSEGDEMRYEYTTVGITARFPFNRRTEMKDWDAAGRIEDEPWRRRPWRQRSAGAVAEAQGQPQTAAAGRGRGGGGAGVRRGRERLLLDFGWRSTSVMADDPAQDFNFRGNFSKTGDRAG